VDVAGNDLTGVVLVEDECACRAECLDPTGTRWRLELCEGHTRQKRARRERNRADKESRRRPRRRRRR